MSEVGGSLALSTSNGLMTFSTDPTVGYFVVDNVELSGSFGLRHVSVEGENSSEFSLIGEPLPPPPDQRATVLVCRAGARYRAGRHVAVDVRSRTRLCPTGRRPDPPRPLRTAEPRPAVLGRAVGCRSDVLLLRVAGGRCWRWSRRSICKPGTPSCSDRRTRLRRHCHANVTIVQPSAAPFDWSPIALNGVWSPSLDQYVCILKMQRYVQVAWVNGSSPWMEDPMCPHLSLLQSACSSTPVAFGQEKPATPEQDTTDPAVKPEAPSPEIPNPAEDVPDLRRRGLEDRVQ